MERYHPQTDSELCLLSDAALRALLSRVHAEAQRRARQEEEAAILGKSIVGAQTALSLASTRGVAGYEYLVLPGDIKPVDLIGESKVKRDPMPVHIQPGRPTRTAK
jgi:hypothetical protein